MSRKKKKKKSKRKRSKRKKKKKKKKRVMYYNTLLAGITVLTVAVCAFLKLHVCPVGSVDALIFPSSVPPKTVRSFPLFVSVHPIK